MYDGQEIFKLLIQYNYNSLKLPIKVRCEKFQQCSIQKSYDYEQENKMSNMLLLILGKLKRWNKKINIIRNNKYLQVGI